MPQLNLNFFEIPIPETCLWEEMEDEHKQLVIETLARLMVKAVRTGHPQEPADDGPLQNQPMPRCPRRVHLSDYKKGHTR